MSDSSGKNMMDGTIDNNIQDLVKTEPLVFPDSALQNLNFFYPFKCDYCSYGTDKITKLFEHNMKKHKPESKNLNPLQCHVCNKSFKYERTLVRHKQKQHQNHESKESQLTGEVKSDQQILKCEICEKVFKHERSLERHRRKLHQRSDVNDKVNKEDHTATKEKDNNIKCKVTLGRNCGTNILKPFDMDCNITVMRRVPSIIPSSHGPSQSVSLNKRNQSKSLLAKSHPCHRCHKSFKRSTALLRHIKSVHFI